MLPKEKNQPKTFGIFHTVPLTSFNIMKRSNKITFTHPLFLYVIIMKAAPQVVAIGSRAKTSAYDCMPCPRLR
jgi:hypothetical protein